MKNFNYFLKTGIKQNLSEETYLQAAQRKADARLEQERELLDRLKKAANKQIDEKGGVNKYLSKRISGLENIFSSKENQEIRNARLYDEEQKRMMRMRANDEKRLGTPISYHDEMPKAVPSVKLPTLKFKNDLEKEAYFASKSAFEAQILGADDETLQRLYDKSIEKSAKVDAERKAGSRISPVYQVTQGDFKTATGRDYDATNPQDRQLFFDLVSRGEPTWSPTAGPGEGPAYGSKEFYTMRRRPTNIPKFETTDAWYDNKTGQLARTSPDQIAFEKEQEEKYQKGKTEELRQRAQEADKRDAASLDKPLRAQRWAMGVPGFDMDSIRREYEVRKEIERGQREKPSPKPTKNPDNYWNYEPDPFAVERGQFPIFPETETDTEPEQIQQIKITPDMSEFKGYVVPESEEWNKLSEREKLIMAAIALTRGETAKFMGGRQKTEGGFLGIGGKKVNRFSEDQSGNTPAETAYLNRVSKMLNQMLDKYEQAAKEAHEYGPEVETGIIQSEMGGGSTVNTKSQLPGNVGQYLDRVLGSPDYSRAKFAKDLQMDLEDEGNRSNAAINYSNFIPDPLPLPLPLPSEPMRVPDLIPIPGEDDGNSVVNTKSQLPGNVGQYLDRVLGRKFTKFGSTKPEISPRPQAPKIDISNMRIVNAPGNVRPYTGKMDPRFINPMDLYGDVLDPMRDRMLGRPMFATTSRRPKDFKPDNEGTMNAPLKLPDEGWTPEDIRRMKTQREMEDMTLDDNYDLPPDVYDLNKKVLKTPTKGKKVKEKVETLESP